MEEITQLQQQNVPVSRACPAFDMPRSSYYYRRRPTRPTPVAIKRPAPPRALSAAERENVSNLLNSKRFVDHAPRQVYATLLDEGSYHCSVSTMYRILGANKQVRERRNQRRHPPKCKPQLESVAPNQLWSWDITKLRTPFKFGHYYLYVILDVYSRFVVGWMIAECESAELAQQLIGQSCARQRVVDKQLTLHADRGGPMVAITTAQLLKNLGVQKTHSRPYTPNDNAFSEAQFKTMKYRPDFPGQFESIVEARQWARRFFKWYNNEHHHSALALLTPSDVHHGRVRQIIQKRTAVLQTAYSGHPERFVRGRPQHPAPPSAVWINRPQKNELGGRQAGR
jgi:putative transposase